MSARDWQRWITDLACRRMAENRDNTDDFGPDETDEELEAAVRAARTPEEEQEAEIRRFIAGGNPHRR